MNIWIDEKRNSKCPECGSENTVNCYGERKGEVMEDTQKLFQSMTIKFLSALVIMILGKMGYDVTYADEASLAAILGEFVALLLVAGAYWGRIRAKKRIVVKSK